MKKKLDNFLESEIVTIFVMLCGIGWITSGAGLGIIVEAHQSNNPIAITLAYLFSLLGFYFSYKIYKNDKK